MVFPPGGRTDRSWSLLCWYFRLSLSVSPLVVVDGLRSSLSELRMERHVCDVSRRRSWKTCSWRIHRGAMALYSTLAEHPRKCSSVMFPPNARNMHLGGALTNLCGSVIPVHRLKKSKTIIPMDPLLAPGSVVRISRRYPPTQANEQNVPNTRNVSVLESYPMGRGTGDVSNA